MKKPKNKIIITICIIVFILSAFLAISAVADDINLYSKDDTVKQTYIKNNELTKSTSYAVSGYIKVSANAIVNVGKIYQTYNQVPLAACYDADKNLIKDIEYTDAEIERVTSLIAVANFTTPENTAYIRVNFDSRFSDTFVVTSGEKMNSDKIYEIIGEEKPIKHFDSVLYEKSILFIGDSLCNGSTDTDKDKYPTWGWAGRFAYYDEMKVTKTGVDGYSMATKDCGSAGQIVTQLINNKGKKFDYILLEGGVNDGWFMAPVGQMSESFDKNDFDQTTFAGGFEYTIATAKELFPESKLGFLLYFRLNHPAGNLKKMKPIWDEAIKICEKWDIPVLDLYFDKETCNKYEIPYCKEDGDPFEVAKCNSAINKITVDGCHPNGVGYDRLYNAINDFLISLSEPAQPTPTPDDTTPTPADTTETPSVDPTQTPSDTPSTAAPTSTTTPGGSSNGSALPFIIAGAAVAIVAGVCVAIFAKKKIS